MKLHLPFMTLLPLPLMAKSYNDIKAEPQSSEQTQEESVEILYEIPGEQQAAKHIEVARLTIKDLLDQFNKQKQEGDEEKEKRMVPDATAQEILDRELRQRKERQIFERAQWQKAEKDW